MTAAVLCVAAGATTQAASLCPSEGGALRDLVTTEYSFAAKAKESVRSAFLAYLAPDALVLQPYPRPAVAVYTAAKETKDTLEWYPTLVEIAPSGNLGFPRDRGPSRRPMARPGRSDIS